MKIITIIHLCIMISFGYPLDAAKLTAEPRRGGRRAFGQVVHIENW